MVFSLCASLFWELRDKRNLKNLQFLPESLGAMLEYRYIERGLLYRPFMTRSIPSKNLPLSYNKERVF